MLARWGLVLAAIGLLSPETALAQNWKNCTTKGVHLIVARGHNYIPPDRDPWNVLRAFRTRLLSQIPGSDAYAVPYNYGGPAYDLTGYAPGQQEGIANGTTMIQDALRSYTANCPNSKVALLGFSEGATALMNAVCGMNILTTNIPPLEAKYAKNVVATISWGDMTKSLLVPWNLGTCPNNLIPGLLNRVINFTCRPFAPHLRNWCDIGDKWCCPGTTSPDPGDPHGAYLRKYSQDDVNYIKQQLGMKV